MPLLRPFVYIANSHTIFPNEYKRAHKQPTLIQEAKFNQSFAYLRGTVKRFNVYIDRHRSMHVCARTHVVVVKLFRLMWNTECLLFTTEEKISVDHGTVQFWFNDDRNLAFVRPMGPIRNLRSPTEN